MRPCDCGSQHDVENNLKEQGLRFNEWSIIVRPLSVILSNDVCTIRIPQKRFRDFAEWYLEDQES